MRLFKLEQWCDLQTFPFSQTQVELFRETYLEKRIVSSENLF